MKIQGNRISQAFKINKNQNKIVNQILGYDIDEVSSELLANNEQNNSLNHIKTKMGYREVKNYDAPNNHLYNNIADLQGSLKHSANDISSNDTNSNKPDIVSNVHHHHYPSKKEPKIFYKTNNGSKLIPLINQENIDGVSNVFAPYIHLEIPPHFVQNQDS